MIGLFVDITRGLFVCWLRVWVKGFEGESERESE